MKYKVEKDKYQFILKEKNIVQEGKNAGKEYYESIGFFPSLEAVAKRLIHLGMEGTINIEKIIEAVERSTKRITDEITLV